MNTAIQLDWTENNPLSLCVTHIKPLNVIVSTVSLSSPVAQILDPILGSLPLEGRADLSTPGVFETMVFRCDDDGEVTDWSELDFCHYNSETEAKKGHADMVAYWLVKETATSEITS